MLTPAQLVNPKRVSGFNYVAYKDPNGVQTGHGGGKPFVAEYKVRQRPVPADAFRGPRRATAAEAAQDYCDYMNGLKVLPQKILKTANHPTRRKGGRKVPQEVAAAYGTIRDYHARARAEEGVKNYVYLMGEWGAEYVKIGESAKPPARPGECQTGNARKLVLLAYYEVSVLRDADKALHQQFAGDHVLNEWFNPTDAILSHFKVTRKELLRRCGGKATKGAKQPA